METQLGGNKSKPVIECVRCFQRSDETTEKPTDITKGVFLVGMWKRLTASILEDGIATSI